MRNAYLACMREFSDEDLLVLVRKGDKKAFGELYERYQEKAYKYILTLLKVPELAEDSVHELFLKFWETREKWAPTDGSFQKYFFRAAYNHSIDNLRKVVKDKELNAQLIHYYELYSTEYYTEEEMKRFDKLVDEAFDRLTPQARRVYELCRQQGKSYKEAAEILGISPNTVHEHMQRALAILREFVRDKGEFVLLIILLEKIFR